MTQYPGSWGLPLSTLPPWFRRTPEGFRNRRNLRQQVLSGAQSGDYRRSDFLAVRLCADRFLQPEHRRHTIKRSAREPFLEVVGNIRVQRGRFGVQAFPQRPRPASANELNVPQETTLPRPWCAASYRFASPPRPCSLRFA